MTRSVAKVVIVLILWVAVIEICIALDRHFHSWWTAGLGGGFGYLAVIGSSKLFDRVWPKPPRGWSE